MPRRQGDTQLLVWAKFFRTRVSYSYSLDNIVINARATEEENILLVTHLQPGHQRWPFVRKSNPKKLYFSQLVMLELGNKTNRTVVPPFVYSLFGKLPGGGGTGSFRRGRYPLRAETLTPPNTWPSWSLRNFRQSSCRAYNIRGCRF